MAEENIVVNISATSNFSDLIGDVNRVAASLGRLQQSIVSSDKALSKNLQSINAAFKSTLVASGQFSSHFVSLSSDAEKFGKSLDSGRLKLKDYFSTLRTHINTQGGLVRDLAKQQVQLQNAVIQPLGKNAQGLMQYNVMVARGIDEIANKTKIAQQQAAIMNKVIQQGAGQLINWGKNTQWAGRQLTVGLTLPVTAFGKAAADAFRVADKELVRLTKVYGDLGGTTSAELQRVRRDVQETARELAAGYGASFKETLALSADIAATGKTGEELLGSIKETTRLAVLGEVDRQEAMKATLAIQSAFKQNTDQLTDSINFLNAVENQTSTTLNDLVEAIPKAGPVIMGLGGSVQDLALYMTAMREGGIAAGEGANALKSALASLINPTDVAVKKFKTLGIDLLGIVNQNAGNVTQTLFALQAALDRLDPLQKQQAIEQLFGKFQFSRLNALFENLGRQGSQTLQVLDLMKASTAELGAVAERELTAVTESASGRYARAVESLKADLASIGEGFLGIATQVITVINKAINFVEKLPDPIKRLLTIGGAITAIAGPIIMLTGVLANFFGYIIKGVSHFRAFFKGAEGWKLLTPEILAANAAGDLVEDTFYRDAKAAQVLKDALQNLVNEYSLLQQQASSGAISLSQNLSTVGGAPLFGSREVDPRNPLAGKFGTRASAHMNPRGLMTPEERSSQTFLGMVPSAIPVNQLIGQSPMILSTTDLPKVPGLTNISRRVGRGASARNIDVSTGILADQAAKWHAMTSTLAMMSETEIAELKQSIATTGIATQTFMDAFDDILPQLNQITDNGAKLSAGIVAELQAGKISLDQAKLKIMQINAQVERLMGEVATGVAAASGRTIDLSKVPLIQQAVADPQGRSNMRQMFRGENEGFIVNLGSSIGVRTSGAGYNVQTTRPRRLNSGGYVYTMNDGNIVPGPAVNRDIVPAILTPGEFVVNREATQKNLPLLRAINGTGSQGPGFNRGTRNRIANRYSGRELAHLDDAFRSSARPDLHAQLMEQFGLTSEQLNDPRTSVKSGFIAAYDRFFNQGTARGDLPTQVAADYLSGIPIPVDGRGLYSPDGQNYVTHDPMIAYEGLMADLGIPSNEKRSFARMIDRQIAANLQAQVNAGNLILSDRSGSAPGRASTNILGQSIEDTIRRNKPHLLRALTGLKEPQEVRVARQRSARDIARGRGASTNRVFRLQEGRVSSAIASQRAGRRQPTFVSRAAQFMAAAATRRPLTRTYGGIIPGYNAGGLVPGYNVGGQVGRMLGMSALSTVAFSGGQQLGQSIGGDVGGQIGGTLGATLPFMFMGMGGGRGGMDISAAYDKSILKGTQFGQSMAGQAAMGGRLASVLGRAALSLSKFNLALGAGVAIGTLVFRAYRNKQEELGRLRDSFSLTADEAQKAGVNFVDMKDKLVDAAQAVRDLRERNQLLYESMVSANTPFKMTIEQYKALKKEVKEQFGDKIELINKSSAQDAVNFAKQLKEQLVIAGMSAQEAAKKIYALFNLTNKAGLAVSATVGNEAFNRIQDPRSALTGALDSMQRARLTGDVEAQYNALQTVFSGISASTKQIITDSKGATSEYAAQSTVLDQIVNTKGAEVELGQRVLDHLRDQDPMLNSIVTDQETIVSLYQKMQIASLGYSGSLKVSVEEAEALYNLINQISQQTIEETKTGILAGEYAELASLEKQQKALRSASKGMSAAKQIDTKKRIELLQKEIDKINEAADARKRALQEEQQDENISLAIQKKRLEYQDALAAGDMSKAAQAQLDIRGLVGEQQRVFAERSIEERRKRDVAPREAEIEKLRKAQDNAANAASLATDKLNALSTKIQEQKDKINAVNNSLTDFRTGLALGKKNVEKQSAAVLKALEALGIKPKTEPLPTAKSPEEAKRQAENRPTLKEQATVLLTEEGIVVTEDYFKKEFKGLIDDYKKAFKGRKSAESAAKTGIGPVQQGAIKYTVETGKNPFVGYGRGRAAGGPVTGPGSSTSDSIPAMLSNGEYVINASAVQTYGSALFDKLNAKRFAMGGMVKYDIPKMANGGMVKSGPSIGSTYITNNPNIVVNPAPGMDEIALANLVVQKINQQNARIEAAQGRKVYIG